MYLRILYIFVFAVHVYPLTVNAATATVKWEIKNKFFYQSTGNSFLKKAIIANVKNNPGDPGAHYLHALLLVGVNDKEAKQEFVKTLELAEHHPYALFYLGNYEMLDNDVKSAISLYQQALIYEKHEPIIYNSCATLYASLGEIDKAIQLLEEGLVNNPNDDSLYFNCAIFLTWHRPAMKNKAHLYLEKAEKLNPAEFDYHKALGFSYIDYRRYDEAKVQFEKALLINPSDIIVKLGLATTYSKKELFREAKEIISEVIKNNPESELAKQELKECEEAYTKWKTKQ